jgi:hypothetical protein
MSKYRTLCVTKDNYRRIWPCRRPREVAADANLILQALGWSEKNPCRFRLHLGFPRPRDVLCVSRHRSPARLAGCDAQVLPDPPGGLFPGAKQSLGFLGACWRRSTYSFLHLAGFRRVEGRRTGHEWPAEPEAVDCQQVTLRRLGDSCLFLVLFPPSPMLWQLLSRVD